MLLVLVAKPKSTHEERRAGQILVDIAELVVREDVVEHACTAARLISSHTQRHP